MIWETFLLKLGREKGEKGEKGELGRKKEVKGGRG